MHFSENEILHTTRKALLGCGFSHDVAEDIGWGVVCASNLVPQTVTEIAELLMRFSAHHSQNRVPFDHQKLSVSGDLLAVRCTAEEMLIYSSAMCDWLISHPTDYSLELSLPFLPYFFAGQLHWIESQYVGHVQISEKDTACLRPSQIIGREKRYGDFKLSFIPQDVPPLHLQKQDRIQIEEAGWKSLSEFAYRSYVPETEESRLHGAGAGLQDND